MRENQHFDCWHSRTGRRYNGESLNDYDYLDKTLLNLAIVLGANSILENGIPDTVKFHPSAPRMAIKLNVDSEYQSILFACGNSCFAAKRNDTPHKAGVVDHRSFRNYEDRRPPHYVYEGTCIDIPTFNYMHELGLAHSVHVDGMGLIAWEGCRHYPTLNPYLIMQHMAGYMNRGGSWIGTTRNLFNALSECCEDLPRLFNPEQVAQGWLAFIDYQTTQDEEAYQEAFYALDPEYVPDSEYD